MARLPHPPPPPTLARAAREWSGWFVLAAGAVLSVLGWYGVAGESVIEQQLPYLASATIPGAAMIVAGAVLIAARPTHRPTPADPRIETLYTLLVTDTDEPQPAPPQPDPPTLLAIPGGTLYHRRDCPLVAGKPTAEPVNAAAIAERGLAPCPVCEPPRSALDRPAPDLPGSDHADGPAPDHPGSDHATEPGADQPSADSAAADQPAPDQPSATADSPADQPSPDHPTHPSP